MHLLPKYSTEEECFGYKVQKWKTLDEQGLLRGSLQSLRLPTRSYIVTLMSDKGTSFYTKRGVGGVFKLKRCWTFKAEDPNLQGIIGNAIYDPGNAWPTKKEAMNALLEHLLFVHTLEKYGKPIWVVKNKRVLKLARKYGTIFIEEIRSGTYGLYVRSPQPHIRIAGGWDLKLLKRYQESLNFEEIKPALWLKRYNLPLSIEGVREIGKIPSWSEKRQVLDAFYQEAKRIDDQVLMDYVLQHMGS